VQTADSLQLKMGSCRLFNTNLRSTKQIASFQNAVGVAHAALTQAQGKVATAELAVSEQNALVQQLDQALICKLAPVQEACDTLHAAEQITSQTTGSQAVAAAALGHSTQAEKASTDAVTAAKVATEKALIEKSAHDKALAAAATSRQNAATPEATAQAAAELSPCRGGRAGRARSPRQRPPSRPR
jgi:hypothetical protein